MEGAFITERHTAQMGAIAVHDQPLILAGLDARGICLWIAKAGDIGVLRRLDLFSRTVANENQFAAPEQFDDLAFSDVAKVEINRSTCSNRRRVRRHLAHKRPNGCCQANGTCGTGRNEEKIASRGFGRSRCVCCSHSGHPRTQRPLGDTPEGSRRLGDSGTCLAALVAKLIPKSQLSRQGPRTLSLTSRHVT